MKRFETDLTDEQWAEIQQFIPKTRTKPRSIDMREVLNAILYVLKTGIQWRFLPKEFLFHYTTANKYLRHFQSLGVWDAMLQALVKKARKKAKRKPYPTIGIIDSQSVSHSNAGGISGYDANKKKRVSSGTSLLIRKGTCWWLL